MTGSWRRPSPLASMGLTNQETNSSPSRQSNFKAKARPRWYLVRLLSSALAFAPLNEAQRNGLLLLAATIIVAGAIIAIASQALAAPLVDLTRVAEKISAGDLSSRARTRAHDVSRTNRFYQQIAGEQIETAHTEDEIDILARTFNNMAAQRNTRWAVWSNACPSARATSPSRRSRSARFTHTRSRNASLRIGRARSVTASIFIMPKSIYWMPAGRRWCCAPAVAKWANSFCNGRTASPLAAESTARPPPHDKP